MLKGFSLVVPPRIRATEGKVRQALFNILGEAVMGARVMDGFAGSGAIGLEALSRGAGVVVFLEQDAACLKAIERNLARVPPGRMTGRWEILRGDARRSLRGLGHRAAAFDVIWLDPPYTGPLGKKALKLVAECAIVTPSGVVCWEHARQSDAPSSVGPLALRTQHRYGETVLSFYRMAPQYARQTPSVP